MKLRIFTRPAALVAGLVLLVSNSRGQTPGALDPAFTTGSGPTNEVRALAVQPDGKILVGGRFPGYNGASRVGIARINADGSLDTTFDPGTGLSGSVEGIGVYAVGVQADGKIVIGGVFDAVNGAPHVNLARLNANGSVDGSFNVTTSEGTLQSVRTLAIQSNGKILFGGAFDRVNGVGTSNVARVNADGSFDPSFNSGTVGGDLQRFVSAIGIQPDGKIVLGGKMESNNILRLNADGSLDASFDITTSPDNTVYALAIQSDGKIVIGGGFSEIGDYFRFNIARINADGTLDLGYKPNLGQGDFVVLAIGLQSDGKAVVGGEGDDRTLPGIARVNTDGSIDTAYTASIPVEGSTIYAIRILPGNNDTLIGGRFGIVNGTSVNSVAALLSGPLGSTHPGFFNGEVALGEGVYYLAFPGNGNIFGYYRYLEDPKFVYHYDLGFEYVFDLGNGGVVFYDFASNDYFYTSPSFAFPYLYDFGLQAFLYYYPDPTNPQRYNTNGVRYFFNFSTNSVITK